MTLKQDILDQLDGLIQQGDRLDKSFALDGQGAYESQIFEQQFRAFATMAYAAITRIAGDGSEYSRHLPKIGHRNRISVPGYSLTFVPSILGVLIALREAVDNGYLVSLESRLRANIHDDFLQQAKALLDSGYHVAAMVLVGGVLEDHLQKLCVRHGLTWQGDGSISKYNDQLHGSIYDKPTWRRIQSMGDIRNSAAHGQGATVKVADVEDGHRFVGRFIVDHPA